MSTDASVAAQAVRDTVYRSCLFLDDENWEGFFKFV